MGRTRRIALQAGSRCTSQLVTGRDDSELSMQATSRHLRLALASGVPFRAVTCTELHFFQTVQEAVHILFWNAGFARPPISSSLEKV